MIRIQIDLYEHQLEQGQSIKAVAPHTAVWLCSGDARVGEKILKSGDGCYLGTNDISPVEGGCRVLCYEISKTEQKIQREDNAKLLLQSTFEWPDAEAILRLDSVTFPKAAIAYRHSHAAAGTRYLTRGELEIVSDDHSEQIKPGGVWFEDAHYPVTAIASTTEISQFVRVLVLPPEYEGKSTIKYLNVEDDEKPKLQEYHRFFEQPICF